MERFFAPGATLESTSILLSTDEAHHALRVLRKSRGDRVEVINGRGLLAQGEIDSIGKKEVSIRIVSAARQPRHLPQITLAIATIRPNRMDWAVEKLTELGVSTIQPLLSTYASVKVFKHTHLEKIAVSALKQCGRFYLPEISPLLPFSEWLSSMEMRPGIHKLIAHIDPEAATAATLLSPGSREIICAIGPEGGFSDAELSAARSAGFQTLRLDDAVLRAETAAVVAVSQLKQFWYDSPQEGLKLP